jgi:hypothetical protein
MLTNKMVDKFNTIFQNWENGNKHDAAAQIKKLSKLELALLISEAETYCGDILARPFTQFIVSALSNLYKRGI